jgi:hypothetical protein
VINLDFRMDGTSLTCTSIYSKVYFNMILDLSISRRRAQSLLTTHQMKDFACQILTLVYYEGINLPVQCRTRTPHRHKLKQPAL